MPNFDRRSHRKHNPSVRKSCKDGRAQSRKLKAVRDVLEFDCRRDGSGQDCELISPHFSEANERDNHDQQAVEI